MNEKKQEQPRDKQEGTPKLLRGSPTTKLRKKFWGFFPKTMAPNQKE